MKTRGKICPVPVSKMRTRTGGFFLTKKTLPMRLGPGQDLEDTKPSAPYNKYNSSLVSPLSALLSRSARKVGALVRVLHLCFSEFASSLSTTWNCFENPPLSFLLWRNDSMLYLDKIPSLHNPSGEVGSRRKLKILERSFRCCRPKCRIQEGLEQMMGSLIEHLSARRQHTLLETNLSLWEKFASEFVCADSSSPFFQCLAKREPPPLFNVWPHLNMPIDATSTGSLEN